MRTREEKAVITFHTTAAAMAAEKACKEAGLPGRLIPVPRQLSAGCGFAWCSGPECKQKLEELLRERKVEYEESCVLFI